MQMRRHQDLEAAQTDVKKKRMLSGSTCLDSNYSGPNIAVEEPLQGQVPANWVHWKL